MSCSWHDRLKEAYLRVRARQYARTLRPGSAILEDTDGETIAEFRQYLPAALAELHLEAVACTDGSGFVIIRTGGWEDEPTQPSVQIKETYARARCRCGLPWFECGCKSVLEVPATWGRA